MIENQSQYKEVFKKIELLFFVAIFCLIDIYRYIITQCYISKNKIRCITFEMCLLESPYLKSVVEQSRGCTLQEENLRKFFIYPYLQKSDHILTYE